MFFPFRKASNCSPGLTPLGMVATNGTGAKPIERIVWYKCQDKAWSMAPLVVVVMVRVVKQSTAVTLDVLPGKQANSNKL